MFCDCRQTAVGLALSKFLALLLIQSRGRANKAEKSRRMLEMKKTLLTTAIFMLSAAWAVAQSTPGSQQPVTPGASSPSSSMPSPQSTAPDASPSSTTTTQTTETSTDSSTAIEGCLSGSSGNFTLTDQSGKAYQLAGDTSKLTEHVGHQIRVMGSSSDSSAASSASGSNASAGGASSGSSTFTVKKVKMISSSCSTK
jgi:hypothetical protein